MAILLAALGVAFAAFCVRLTVHIVNRSERWAKRVAVAAVTLPLLYFLSFGPVCWMIHFRHSVEINLYHYPARTGSE